MRKLRRAASGDPYREVSASADDVGRGEEADGIDEQDLPPIMRGVNGEAARYWCVVAMMCLKCAFIEMFCKTLRSLTFLTYGWTLRRLPRVWQAPPAR